MRASQKELLIGSAGLAVSGLLSCFDIVQKRSERVRMMKKQLQDIVGLHKDFVESRFNQIREPEMFAKARERLSESPFFDMNVNHEHIYEVSVTEIWRLDRWSNKCFIEKLFGGSPCDMKTFVERAKQDLVKLQALRFLKDDEMYFSDDFWIEEY
jgi:hypothetical protein